MNFCRQIHLCNTHLLSIILCRKLNTTHFVPSSRSLPDENESNVMTSRWMPKNPSACSPSSKHAAVFLCMRSCECSSETFVELASLRDPNSKAGQNTDNRWVENVRFGPRHRQPVPFSVCMFKKNGISISCTKNCFNNHKVLEPAF